MLALVVLKLTLDALLSGLQGDQLNGYEETENEGGAVDKTFHTIILGTAPLCLHSPTYLHYDFASLIASTSSQGNQGYFGQGISGRVLGLGSPSRMEINASVSA